MASIVQFVHISLASPIFNCQILFSFVFAYCLHCVLSMTVGIPCSAGGDAGDYQTAGGGPVCCPTPQ